MSGGNPINGFERMAGVPADAIVGKTDRDLFPPRLADAYRANDDQVLSKNRGLEIEETVLQSDGVHVYHSVKFPLLDAAGGRTPCARSHRHHRAKEDRRCAEDPRLEASARTAPRAISSRA